MNADPADLRPPSPQTALSPFRYPAFRSIWAANLVSNMGGMIYTVGAAWLMASITSSPAMVALVQSSATLPIMLLSLATGALADNVDRRLMMISAQSFMLVVSVVLALCVGLWTLTPWLLLLLTFLIGCGAAANTPAWQASVGDLVPRRELSSAVALNSVGFNIARSLGPAVGGAIVAAAGAAAAFAVNAVSYIGLIVALTRWKPDRSANPLPRETLGEAIAAGLRYTAMSPPMIGVLVRGGLFGIAACSVNALLPLVARDLLQSGPLTYGLLLGSIGLGAIAGAAAGAKLRSRMRTEAVVRVASMAWAAGATVAAVSRSLPLTMGALFAVGAGFLLALSTFNVTVQLSVPRWVVARALSLYQMVTFGGMAVGSWIWGEIASGTSLTNALLAAVGVQLTAAAIGLRLPLHDPAQLNLDPHARWHEPELALPILPRSGPIVITIEYTVKEQDTNAFLAVMQERRRMRLRNGALGWTLLRDLADPKLWIERYHTSTWLDYVRHNSRTTSADAEIAAQLRAISQKIERRRVRRLIERQPTVTADSLPRTPDTET